MDQYCTLILLWLYSPIVESKELAPADIEAGVNSDQTVRTFEMICFYMSGWASLGELEAHIEKMKS